MHTNPDITEATKDDEFGAGKPGLQERGSHKH